ncbi:hypothetical protein [Desulfovibrio inopinatus]|uniref:hypothetical protein n=1 Tax=Desulfovibrio inopinatus TaxID=102109 RepID=UPI0004207ED4|nr:hypothetical protein [Desulfovibrio inopinatus]
MNSSIENAAKDIAEIFSFEHWLRFYFAVEKDDKLYVEVPEEVIEAVTTKHPNLAQLAREVNGKPTDYQSSQQNVCAYVFQALEGDTYRYDTITDAFDSQDFKIDMYVFSLWIKGHENYLDEKRLDFDDWQYHFEQWKAMEQVQNYIIKLKGSKEAEKISSCQTQ